MQYATTALVLFQKEEILPQFSIETLKGHLYSKKYPNSMLQICYSRNLEYCRKKSGMCDRAS